MLVMFSLLFVIFPFCVQAHAYIFEDMCPCFSKGENKQIIEVENQFKMLIEYAKYDSCFQEWSVQGLHRSRSEYKKQREKIWPRHNENRKIIYDTVEKSHLYPSDFQICVEKCMSLILINRDWKIFFTRLRIHDYELYKNLPKMIKLGYLNDIIVYQKYAKLKQNKISELQCETWPLFEKVYEYCHQNHISLRSLHEFGYLQLLQGNHEKSIRLAQKLIEYSEKCNNSKYLTANTFENLGMSYTLSHDYDKAIEVLTKGIKKHPKKKELYIERAIAYFEQGDFEKALEDYIASGKAQQTKLPITQSKLKFAKGFLKGAVSGTLEGAKEMPASLWHSAKGACNLLWTTAKHPIDTSERVVDAVYDTINYLKNEDLSKIGKKLVPEMYKLLKKWDSWSASTQGKKAGFVIGKYGVNIFFAYGSVKAIERIQKLRHANALANLKTMSLSKHSKDAVIKQTEKIAAARTQFYTKAHIHADKQGKHIVGHKNYDPTKNKSIFTHQNPEQLLEKHAGKGRSTNNKKFGEAGYKEAVDFGEEIGYVVDRHSGKRTLTTRGTIHYDQNGGAHIVPLEPLK